MAKILPSRSAATRMASPSTSTGTRSPAAMSLDFRTGTHSSYMIQFLIEFQEINTIARLKKAGIDLN